MHRLPAGDIGHRGAMVGLSDVNVVCVFVFAAAVMVFVSRQWRAMTTRADAARWAHRDALTGLPDRVVFHERLQAALDHPRAACVGAFMIDIDRYRLVNASYGQRAGDDVLASIAERLHTVLGPDDFLARLAGDQFAVLCPNMYDGRHAEQVADRVRGALVRPFNVDGEQVWLTACIGIALDDGNIGTAGSLQREAEAALERAQSAGPGHHL